MNIPDAPYIREAEIYGYCEGFPTLYGNCRRHCDEDDYYENEIDEDERDEEDELDDREMYSWSNPWASYDPG